MTKRGFTYAEAIDYVGVKRRTFDEQWRPHLVAMRAGAALIFDRTDLDRLFDEKKRQAAGERPAANDAGLAEAQNAPGNGRPAHKKGVKPWANERGASTPPRTEPGKSTSTGAVSAFASAVSTVTKKRTAG